jgi:hypothetical protein
MRAAILQLDNAPDATGCVRPYPGSHKLGPFDLHQGGFRCAWESRAAA